VLDPCTVLIASADLLPTLKPRAADGASELLAFTDADALRALEVITKRRPRLVTLERMFAATPRGAALIHRIKADPSLLELEIRVIAHDTDYARVLPRQPGAGAAGVPGTAPGAPKASAAAAAAPAGTAVEPLDQRGTRRAPRFRIAAKVEVMVDGNAATLVDLSTVGAQVVSAGVLKPNQRVRLGLTDAAGNLRFNAAVAWAKFEIPSGGGPRYRAGLDFVDANHVAIDAYCARHKAP
jgi:PilZ domain